MTPKKTSLRSRNSRYSVIEKLGPSVAIQGTQLYQCLRIADRQRTQHERVEKVNAAVLMPTPNANVAIAIAAKAGFLPRRRNAKRMSWITAVILPQDRYERNTSFVP